MFNNFKFQFHVQHGLAEFGSHSEGEPSGKANSPPPHLKEAINKIFFLVDYNRRGMQVSTENVSKLW